MIYCPRCGTENNPSDKYCKNCGNSLEKPGPNPIPNPMPQQDLQQPLEQPIQTKPIRNENKAQKEFLKEANKKASPITFVIIGAIVLVMLLVLWIASNFLNTTQTYTLNVSGYSYSIPVKYTASVSDEKITLIGSDYAEDEGIVIQVYGDDYEGILTNFKQLIEEDNLIEKVTEKDFEDETWIVANYKTEEYKGVIGIRRISDQQSFWVQVLTDDYARGEELLKEISPILNEAKWIGTN